MTERYRNLRTIVVAGLALIIVLLLVANVGRTELGGEEVADEEVVDQLLAALFPIALVLWGVLMAYAIIGMFNRRGRAAKEGGKDSNATPRWFALVVILILVAGLAMLLYSGDLGNDRTGLPGGGDGDETVPTDPDDGASAPQVSPWSAVGLAVIGAAILVLALRYLMWKRSDRQVTRRGSISSAQGAVLDDAISEIMSSTGDELRDAIVRAYDAMCRLLPPGRWDVRPLTPREFAEQAIQVLGWPSAPVNELTHIFEMARYSPHPIAPVDRERALSCLETIRVAVVKEGVNGAVITPQAA